MPAELIPLASVQVNERHRQELGDIDALAASIAKLGLLQPIGLTPERELLFGRRRLEAYRRLGRETIPALVLPDLSTAVDRLQAERDENTCRKEMTPSELVALGRALEEIERPKAQARSQAGRTQRRASLGSARPTSWWATPWASVRPATVGPNASIEAAEDEAAPQDVRDVALRAREQMDATGRPYGPYRELQEAKRRAGVAHDPGEARRARGLLPARLIKRIVSHLRNVIAAGEIAPDLDLEGFQASADELATIAEAITLLQRMQRRLAGVAGTAEAAVTGEVAAREDDKSTSTDSVKTSVATGFGSVTTDTTPRSKASAVRSDTAVNETSLGDGTRGDATAGAAFAPYPRDEQGFTKSHVAAWQATAVGVMSPLPFFDQDTAKAGEAASLSTEAASHASAVDHNGDLMSSLGTGADPTCKRPSCFDAAEVEDLREAAALVVSNAAASVPLLVKRLDVDGAQAKSLIEALEGAGIVGPDLGQLSRSVIPDDQDEAERLLDVYLASRVTLRATARPAPPERSHRVEDGADLALALPHHRQRHPESR